MDVQDILKQLEVNEGTFPREAVAQAIEQREAITPELLRILEDACNSIEEIAERPPYFAHIYAMYLLAQFREPRAYPLIVQFFSVPGEITLDVTGDLVTEDLARILASVFDGNIDPITSLIENEQANEFVRYAAVESLVALVACGEQGRDDVIAYFKQLFRGQLVRKWSHVWDALVSASTELYPEELMGDIRLAYQHQLVDPYSIGLDSVEAVLSRNKDDVLFKLTLNDRFQRIDETIQEMEGWACFQMQERPSHAPLPDIPLPPPVPVVRTAMKKSKARAKDKGKRKQAKASRRKNRR
jgi:hypothetical protein